MSDQPSFLTNEDLGVVLPEPKSFQQVEGSNNQALPTFVPSNETVLGSKDTSMAGDIGKSALSGLESAAVGIAGTPGDIAQGAAQTAARESFGGLEPYIKLRQFVTGTHGTPEGEEELSKIREQLANKPGEVKLDNVKIGDTSIPVTGEAISHAVEPIAKQYIGTGPEYDPQSKTGQYVKTGMEFAAPGVLGKENALQKTAKIVGGTLGSEIPGSIAESTGFSPTVQSAARMIGGILGSHAGEKTLNVGKDIIAPTEGSEQLIADKIAKARSEGRAATDAEIQDALARQPTGVPGNPQGQMSTYDILGGEGSKLLSKAAGQSEVAKEAATHVNDFLNQRANDTFSRVSDTLDTIMGRPIDAGATQQKILNQKGIDNPIYYKKAMDSSAAQNVGTDAVHSVYTDPLVQPAFKEAFKAFGNNYEPSLKFADEVKKNLDAQISKAYLDKNTVLADNLKDRRSKLVNDLDSTVPDYANARNEASQFFQADNAIQAGYNYGKNMNAFDRAKAKAAISKYSPDQAQLFQEGYISSLKDKALGAGSTSAIIDKLDNPITRQKIIDVVGPQKAQDIAQMVKTENIYRHDDAIKFANQIQSPYSLAGSNLATPAVGLGTLGTIMATLATPTLAGLTMAGGALVLGAGKLALTAQEQRVFNQASEILKSRDPAQIAKLSRMADQNPPVRSLLSKIEDLTQKSVAPAIGSVLSSEEHKNRQGRADGGKVISSDSLIRNAEMAKNRINKNTEPLLGVPDETITKALALANKAI